MLTNRNRAFCREYVKDWNATRSAAAVGYSEKTAYSIGSRLLKKVEVAAEISRLVAELAMGPAEVLQRLADQARGDIAQVMDVSSMGFSLNMQAAKDAGLSKLIKKVRQTTITKIARKPSDDDEERTTLEIELYDAQAALVHLGRHHGLFTDTLKLEGSLNVTNLQQVLDTAYGSDNAGSGDNDQGE